MKKRLLYGLLMAVLALNLLVGAQIYFSNAQAVEKDDAYSYTPMFMRVMETIRQHYVDGGKVSYEQLFNGAIKGMVSTLDPHSEFMEPAKFTALKNDTEGTFGGVGIIIGLRTNALRGTVLTVSEPMEDTPALHAGILTGDMILKIGDRSTERFTLDDAVKVLRGAPGTDVTLTIYRPSTDKEFEVKLTRAIIKVATVKDLNGEGKFPLGEGGIGYLRLRQFGEHSTEELEEALKKIEAQDVKGLIMDLRDNPGGLLDQAVKVCEKFLPKNQLVVSTEGRVAADRYQYFATGKGVHPYLPMVILVNGNSASASEIVSGCLQDLKRAIVVGEQTFGKGSVQSILPMSDGYALRLTTAKYYTPSHKVIHEKGITPDILVPMTPEEEQNLALKRTVGGYDFLEPARQEAVRNTRD
ncbi:MAG: S41 family peptidase, partial [Verrucomicrobia bacterium]|nr:S41 family peptidase [Verrucomicrobiota bacterium]